MIIVFFAGLIVMVSGSSVSEACNITYLNLICNIVGGIMMGSGAYCFIKEKEKKKDELILLAEKLVGKEDQEHEMNVLVSIETLLQEQSKVLSIIEEDQKRVIDIVGDSSEIADGVGTIKASLDNHFNLLKKEMNNLSEKNAKGFEKLSGVTKNVGQIIEAEKPLLNEAVETLHKDNVALVAKTEDTLSQLIKNTADLLNIVQLQATEVLGEKNTIVEFLKTIDQRIERLNILPREISESVDELIARFGDSISSIQNDYKNLAEDLDDQEKNRTKKFSLIMNEIRDNAEEYNEEMSEEMKRLSDQYTAFEKTIFAIVEQMSHMAEEDIKVMKGFLNG